MTTDFQLKLLGGGRAPRAPGAERWPLGLGAGRTLGGGTGRWAAQAAQALGGGGGRARPRY